MLRFWIAFRILFGLSFLIDLNFVLTLALFTISIFTIFYVNMPDYIPHEIIDMILILGECRENYRAVARLYRERCPDRRYLKHTAYGPSQLFSACAARTTSQN